MIQKFIKWLDSYKRERAIKKANNLKLLTGYKQLVLLQEGKYIVVSKQSLKKRVKLKYFHKGVSIQVLEKIAIYKTI
jgi:hypothetical protein